MAINYTQAFNAGEISRKMDGRNDLEVYKTGCRDLDNFLVLPQGGVERRAGTEFIQFAGSGGTPDGTNPARIIEFDFSSDIRFVIELGTSYAKVHYTDDSGVDQVVNVTETDNINYTTAELRQIQFNRKYDTLILTCPTKETMILTRDTITPTFSIKNIAQEIIDAKLAVEKMQEMSTMIDMRFGHGTWSKIVSTRRQRIKEERERIKKERILKIKRRNELIKEFQRVSIVAICMIIFITLLFIGLANE